MEHNHLRSGDLHSSVVFELLMGLRRGEALLEQISQKARLLFSILNDFRETWLLVEKVISRGA